MMQCSTCFLQVLHEHRISIWNKKLCMKIPAGLLNSCACMYVYRVLTRSDANSADFFLWTTLGFQPLHILLHFRQIRMISRKIEFIRISLTCLHIMITLFSLSNMIAILCTIYKCYKLKLVLYSFVIMTSFTISSIQSVLFFFFRLFTIILL